MPISSADFEFVRTIVRADSAIALDAGKEYLVESRLGILARQEGVDSLEALIANVRNSPQHQHRYKIVQAMTTNETSFFRDGAPFDALRRIVIPDMIEKRAARKTLRIWSAASSTGQEPFSVAMLLREHFPVLETWNVRIIATDLSRDVLAKARSGAYTQLEVNRGLPASMLIKYFEKDGVSWKIKSPIRSMVDFRELNLNGNWSGVNDCDIILMRNVLIYFDIESKKQILQNVRKNLAPGGYFLLGSAESTMKLDDNFARVPAAKTSCYQTIDRN